MEIDCLYNHPRFINKLVEALWVKWSNDYIWENKTIEDIREFYSTTNISTFPICYILFENDVLYACLLVDSTDMQVRNDLCPWLGSVFTFPEHREKGYAAQLIKYTIRKHPNIYLWCCSEELVMYYKQFGFIVIDDNIIQHAGYEKLTVMQHTITTL